jgi:hypothetical protein
MNDTAGRENAAAAREAREAVASRPRTSGSTAREAALRRFLGAAAYHEKHVEDRDDQAEDES